MRCRFDRFDKLMTGRLKALSAPKGSELRMEPAGSGATWTAARRVSGWEDKHQAFREQAGWEPQLFAP